MTIDETNVLAAGQDNVLLTVSSGPHIHEKASISRLMLWVVLALTPAAVMTVLLFGLHGLLPIVLAVVTAMAADWIINTASSKKASLPDGSAAVTGLLLALSLPPHTALWVAPCGSLFAIAVVKMSLGGLGKNFLNPALAGRAFCLIAFPAAFTAAAVPQGGSFLPLPEFVLNLVVGFQGPWMGGSSAGALLIGAILLWSLRIIDFSLPLSFIATVFLLSWVFGGFPLHPDGLAGPIADVLSGGVLMGAFFLATDPVTSPSTRLARTVFGICCGILTVLLSRFGAASDGVMYAILLMNCTVPYLNRWFMHRPLTMRRGGPTHAA